MDFQAFQPMKFFNNFFAIYLFISVCDIDYNLSV